MKQNKGLTIPEVLVVIASLAVVTALVVSVMKSLLQASDRSHHPSCFSNIKTLGTGLMMYIQDYDETYPNYRFQPLGTQPNGDIEKHSWKSAIGVYIKNSDVFVCPDNPSNQTASLDPKYKISYAANTALNPRNYPLGKPISLKAKGSGVFGNELSPGVNISDVVAPNECITLVEVVHQPQNNFCVDMPDAQSMTGSEGQKIRVFSDTLFVKYPNETLNGRRGSCYVFADGHVDRLTPLQTNESVNFWYRDGSKLSEEGKRTLTNAEANPH